MSQLIELRPGAGERTHINSVVLELRKLRAASQKSRYQGGPLPELPSRDAMIDIVDALVSVVYPRHFGPPGLRAGDLDDFIAETLDATSRSLDEQVRRELLLFSRNEDETPAELERRATAITREFILELPKVRALLDTDISAAFEGIRPPKAMMRSCFAIRASRRLFVIVSRISFIGWASRCWRGSSPKSLIRRPASIYIRAPRSAKAFSSIMEPASSSARRRLSDGACALSGRHLGRQALRGGRKRRLVKGRARHPIIEDEVVIYAGATVLGRITSAEARPLAAMSG